jgi:hypothetical protein
MSALEAWVAEQAFLVSVFECVDGFMLWFYSFTLHYAALRGVGWFSGWNDGRNCVHIV